MIERHLLRVAKESLRGFRVTVINGPRQSGKTTLAKQLVEGLRSNLGANSSPVSCSTSAIG